MKYTTREIANYLGLEVRGMVYRLRKMGYVPCGYNQKNIGVWDVNLDDVKQKFILSKKVNQKKTISVSLLAKKYNMSNGTINNYLKNAGIQPLVSTLKSQIYPISVCDILDKFGSDNVEHPLVKDKRCLNRNWWPDTVPKCFEGLDDD